MKMTHYIIINERTVIWIFIESENRLKYIKMKMDAEWLCSTICTGSHSAYIHCVYWRIVWLNVGGGVTHTQTHTLQKIKSNMLYKECYGATKLIAIAIVIGYCI